MVMDTCRDNAASRLLRRASQLGDKYAVVPKLSFANAVRVSFFDMRLCVVDDAVLKYAIESAKDATRT